MQTVGPLVLAAGFLCCGCAHSEPALSPEVAPSPSIPPRLQTIQEPAQPPAAVPEQKPDMLARLLGKWSEEFVGRGGCSDLIIITEEEGVPTASGKDCNDGKSYVFDPLQYDGVTLSLTLHVPETKEVVRYQLGWLPDGSLAGKSVVGQQHKEVFQVRWTKVR